MQHHIKSLLAFSASKRVLSKKSRQALQDLQRDLHHCLAVNEGMKDLQQLPEGFDLLAQGIDESWEENKLFAFVSNFNLIRYFEILLSNLSLMLSEIAKADLKKKNHKTKEIIQLKELLQSLKVYFVDCLLRRLTFMAEAFPWEYIETESGQVKKALQEKYPYFKGRIVTRECAPKTFMKMHQLIYLYGDVEHHAQLKMFPWIYQAANEKTGFLEPFYLNNQVVFIPNLFKQAIARKKRFPAWLFKGTNIRYEWFLNEDRQFLLIKLRHCLVSPLGKCLDYNELLASPLWKLMEEIERQLEEEEKVSLGKASEFSAFFLSQSRIFFHDWAKNIFAYRANLLIKKSNMLLLLQEKMDGYKSLVENEHPAVTQYLKICETFLKNPLVATLEDSVKKELEAIQISFKLKRENTMQKTGINNLSEWTIQDLDYVKLTQLLKEGRSFIHPKMDRAPLTVEEQDFILKQLIRIQVTELNVYVSLEAQAKKVEEFISVTRQMFTAYLEGLRRELLASGDINDPIFARQECFLSELCPLLIQQVSLLGIGEDACALKLIPKTELEALAECQTLRQSPENGQPLYALVCRLLGCPDFLGKEDMLSAGQRVSKSDSEAVCPVTLLKEHGLFSSRMQKVQPSQQMQKNIKAIGLPENL